MTFLDRLERLLAPLAIPGLIRYIVALNALVFILVTTNEGYESMLVLDRAAVLRGEVWRLVSWIFLPTTKSMFWIFFYLMVTWWLGDMLEQSWGTFRLNAYYFLGMVLCTASAMIFGVSGGVVFLTLSMFLAVATLAPNMQILVFFVIPLKMKWAALISLALPALAFVAGSLPEKMIIAMCLGNYLVFFAPGFVRGWLDRAATSERRARFEARKMPEDETLHRCEVCGATEVSHPATDFRVAADGREYCDAHRPPRD